MMDWAVVSRHLFRRTARRRLARLAGWQAGARRGDPEAVAQLITAGVAPSAQLRVGPKRWHGYWVVEQA